MPQIDVDHLLPGLESPGPIYVLPSSFDKAATKKTHPTWGQQAPPSLKSGRFREDEVRFTSGRHMREMLGHFSPGPQYSLPSTVGGSTGNANALMERMAATAPSETITNLATASMPYPSLMPAEAPWPHSGRPTSKLSATQLGGSANFVMTRGAFADPARAGGTDAVKVSTEYWRSATMLQPKEPNYHNSAPNPAMQQRWHATLEQVRDTREQDGIRQSLLARSRPEPREPRRQVADFRSDPPLANVFGSAQAHTDFGQTGGMDRKWRESKVSGYKSTGVSIGPSGGPLRYAFVQPKGPNSIPKGASSADFYGGRPSQFAANAAASRPTK